MGAFYKVAKLPVVGETIMQASAAGFYTSPDLGKDQVRLAYVLCKEDLQRTLMILQKVLDEYDILNNK